MTIKEFYNYCVEHNIADYQLGCLAITKYGDVSYCTAFTVDMLHTDPDNKTVTMWEEDKLLS